MLKLLLADDERYHRDSIINILNNTFQDQMEIYEAKNGREAIEISEKCRPDIIIMDIKMPGINGLKAISEIKKFLPNAYFMIISAYDYFDFAVEAVKNNVKEYILKPFNRSELIVKIQTSVNYVLEEKEKRRTDIENQEKLYNLMPILENELSYSIISDTLHSIDYETYMKYLNVDFNNSCAMVVALSSKELQAMNFSKIQIGECIKDYISRRYKNVASFRFTEHLVYFIQMERLEEKDNWHYDIAGLAGDVRREVKKLFDLWIRIGIGRCYNGVKQMFKSYCEANTALESKGEGTNIVLFETIGTNYSEEKFAPNGFDKQSGEKIALFEAVEQYITENIKEELDLENTAARFNLSSSYFSRTFKEIVGYNFSDYINIVRIKKAKELLRNDGMSIKEVCFTVGYSDPNYFSKVFKKYEGITPKEYKIK